MRIIIGSDIHGSAFYCKKFVKAFQREKADRILLLGDLLYHGPRNDLPGGHAPKEVIALLNPLAEKITCVRGNCDAEVDQMVLNFPCMSDYTILETDGIKIFATHGHLFGEENPPKFEGDFVLLCGHTHVPKCVEYEGFVYMNPGSMSLPKQNSYHGYLIYEDGFFLWKDFEGETILAYKYERNREVSSLSIYTF